MRSITSLIILALLISSTGCMTMRPIEENHSITEAVKVGDTIEIIEKDGDINKFTVRQLNEQFVAGNNALGSHVSIPLEKIESISVEKVDGGRTTLAVLGSIVAIPIIVVGGGLWALCSSGGC